ncbi:MAG: nucleotidyltransferase domain-containing protein [Eggerthellaceae bacterium]|nr:nucleotidyltransferase domain-containing protein [Eggerthellaceae bacterium]
MLTLDHIAKSLEAVLTSYDVSAAYVFGSYARGDASEDSDVDVRLECGDRIGYAQLLDIQEQLEDFLEVHVEIVTNPPELMRPAFRERIGRDEVLLYEAA